MALAIQNFHNISTGLGSHFTEIPPAMTMAFYQVSPSPKRISDAAIS